MLRLLYLIKQGPTTFKKAGSNNKVQLFILFLFCHPHTLSLCLPETLLA